MTEKELIEKIVNEVIKLGHEPSTREWRKILQKHSKPEGGFYSKSEIIRKYTEVFPDENEKDLLQIRKLLRMKPTRTISGVAPITIFTKPYECPGNCIFCPTQKNMPKSYLKEEPGAMRAEKLKFDPFNQTKMRIQALENIGHNTDKVEIIISGGTWTYYEKDYREWYVKQVFSALCFPEFDSEEKELEKYSLEDLQKLNETAKHRCVGLTIETRPDYINEEEIIHLRKLGVTKVQLGVQSLDNEILEKNRRGHTAEDSEKAINLLRLAGFKIHIHWMPNLYGSTLEKDFEDFLNLFKNQSIMPDELKVYPCSVLENTKLKELMDEGKHLPYEEKELIDLLVKCKTKIPEYCRITRLFRDIPSQLIKGGTTKTNLRQIVLEEMKRQNLKCNCIRCREIRAENFNAKDITLNILKYKTNVSEEYFISFLTNSMPFLQRRDSKSNIDYEITKSKILGFLRLSLPKKELSKNHFIEELKNSAMIREVHVYGRSIEIGQEGETQHLGLGTKLIGKAKEISQENNFKKLSVISAVGTREYYRSKGFVDGKLYQCMEI